MRSSAETRVEATKQRKYGCKKCSGEGTVDEYETAEGAVSSECPDCDGSGFTKVASTIDLAALWKAVAAPKADDTVKLALADALAENGDLETASTLDWCVARKRWPKHRKDSWRNVKYWGWAPSSVGDAPKSIGNGLPRPIHEFVEHRNDTLKEAIESLAVGLVTINALLPKWRS